MKSAKDMILADAVETAIAAEQKNVKLFRIIGIESLIIIILSIVVIFK